MKLLRAFPIVALLSMIGIVIARPWTPNDEIITGIPVNDAVRIKVVKSSSGRLRITFDSLKIIFEPVTAGKREWTKISIEGETQNIDTGKPAVPVIARPVLLPNTGNVRLKVNSTTYTDYKNIDVIPRQPIPNDGTDGFVAEPFTVDESAYSSDVYLPTSIAEIGEPVIVRDARVALLTVEPVQVNPVTKSVRIYNSIDVEIVPIGGTGINELQNFRQHPVPGFHQFYEDILGADELAETNANALPGSMLVICRPDTAVTNVLQPYIDWRNRSGRPTTLTTTTASDPSGIQTIITNAYNSNDPPLEMIMLVGDGGTSGSYLLPSYSSDYSTYSDHRYVQLAGNDVIADAFIGRFPCTNAQQLQLMVNRTLNYERSPNMTDTAWFQRGWGYAGTGEPFNRDAVWYCMAQMNARGIPWTGMYYDEHTGNADPLLINTRCNQGLLFWAHRPAYVGQINAGYVTGVTANVNKCFVAMNLTCSSGIWYGPGNTGTQEQLVLNGVPSAPAGAIAAMSTAGSTHSAPNVCILTGAYYALGVKSATNPAEMFFEGKFQIWRNYITQMNQFIYLNNPMGDITANLWTGVPRALTANIPRQIGLGQNRLDITINRLSDNFPMSGVLVTAMKTGNSGQLETYYRITTDDNGHVVLPLTDVTAGNLYVTAVGNKPGLNVIPIVDTVNVVTLPADLALSGYTILDDTTNGRVGNNNGQANPGETIDLNIRLMNIGTNVTAYGTSATLSSSDPRVVVSNPTHTYTNLTPGDSAYGNGLYRVQLMAGLRNNEQIPLRLSVSATDTTQNRGLAVVIPIRSIQLAFISSVMTPATINPGGSADVSVTVRNNGNLATGSVVASLFSLSPLINVTTSSATFTGLSIGLNSSNPSSQPFHFTASTRIFPGTIVTFGVAFDANSVRDTVYFNATIGTRTVRDPTGPDAYGYYAYDAGDTAYVVHPTYDWQNIETVANRLNLSDASMGTDASTLIRLPFSVRYYGALYDTITVCTNGWISFGPARVVYYNGSTTPSYALMNTPRVWRLPTNEGPRNMVAVGWQDLFVGGYPQGVFAYNDTANGYYVITWNGIWQTLSSNTNEYQLIIYDPQRWATRTGDCMLKFQYKNYHSGTATNEIGYATIGIQDSSCTRSVEYTSGGTFSPGASPIAYGSDINRAIVFSTSNTLFVGRASNPLPPDGTTNIPTNTILQWSPGTAATVYTVLFDTINPPLVVVSNHQSGLSYTPILQTNKTYYWRVISSFDSIGSTTNTGPLWTFTTGNGATPAAPGNGIINPLTDATTNSLYLIWTSNSANTETGFYIYRSLDGYAFNLLDSVATGVTQFLNLGLSPNAHYHYRVYSHNAYYSSTQYASANCYTLANTPGAPVLSLPYRHSITVNLTSSVTNNNPFYTQFAIYVSNLSRFLQANGSLDTGTVWQAITQWESPITIRNLDSNTLYVVCIQARNELNIATPFGPADSIRTSSGMNGIKTIGGALPNFVTIHDAFSALQNLGAGTGGVTFSIRGGIYNQPPDSITEVICSSPNAPVIFKPDDTLGVTINVTGTTQTPFAFKMSNSDNITFDGGISYLPGRRFINLNILGSNACDGFRLAGGSDNCCIKNCNVVFESTSNSGYPIRIESSIDRVPFASCNSDSIINNSLVGGISGVDITSLNDVQPFEGMAIVANRIANFTRNGVNFNNIRNSVVSKNEISSTSLISSILYGIRGIANSNQSSNIVFDANWIHDLIPASINGEVRAIYLANGYNKQISNNMINLDAVMCYNTYGIYIGSGKSNIVGNTVRISSNGLDSQSSSSYGLWLGDSTSQDTIVNNILINDRIGGTNGNYCWYNQNSYNLLSFAFCDHNLLNTVNESATDNTFAVGFGSIRYNLLSDLLRVPNYSGDAHSVGYEVRFAGPPNLHINPNFPTPVESAGMLFINSTHDFDGDLRDSLHPDIGSDESNFIGGGDFARPRISMTPLENSRSTDPRSFIAYITDNIGVATDTLRSPRVYFRRASDNTWSFRHADSTHDTTYYFTIPGNPVNALVYYYLAVQDTSSNMITFPFGGNGTNPPGTISPAHPAFYHVRILLTGVKTIGGTNADYSTIREAVNAVNSIGVETEGVTFLIRGGIYNELPDSFVAISADQTFAPAIFRPSDTSSVTINVTGTIAAPFAFKFFNANNISFDGGLASCPERRFITVNLTGTYGYYGFWFANGSVHCSVKNCEVNVSSIADYNFMSIRAYNDPEVIPCTPCDSDSVINCKLNGGNYGIYLYGSSLFHNWYVARNQIADFNFMGLYLNNIVNSQFCNNEIHRLSAGHSSLYGIFSPSSLNANNVFDGNWIHDLIPVYTGFAYGMYVGYGSNSLITNNMIELSARCGTIIGMVVGPDATNIIHNTVHIGGTAGVRDVSSAGINFLASAQYDTIANNILLNERSGGTVYENNSCIASPLSYSAVNFAYSDNNLISTVEENSGDNHYAAAFGTASFNTLTNLRNIGLPWESHSISTPPNFINSPDLHIDPSTPTPVEGAGRYFACVPRDFDGDIRATNAPDIGCDEGNFTRLSVRMSNEKLPMVYALGQNYPNPFNPITRITFALPKASLVTLTVVNALGQEVVRTVSNRNCVAGNYTISFDGSRLPSGIYFYRFRAGSYQASRKMVLMK